MIWRTTGFVLVIILICSFTGPVQSRTQEQEIIDGKGEPIHIHSSLISQPLIIVNAPNTIIENNRFDDGSTILLVSSEGSIIRNNSVVNANSYAIFIEFSDNSVITNNTVINSARDGIIAYYNDNVTVSHNKIQTADKNGIYVEGHNMTISGNQISDISGTGIYMTNSPHSVVQDNALEDIEWTAIAPDVSTFASSRFDGNTLDGVTITREMIDPEPVSSTDDTIISPFPVLFAIIVLSRKWKKI